MYSDFPIHCSRSFHTDPVSGLGDFFVIVQTGILGNPLTFVTPPYTKIETDLSYDLFINARAAYTKGGSAQEPAYNAAYKEIMKKLNKEADYVDGIALGDKDKITLSGFNPTTNPAQRSTSTYPYQPTGVIFVADTPTGEIHTSCDHHDGKVNYGCIVSEGQPLRDGVTMSKDGQVKIPPCLNNIFQSVSHQRQKEFTGLTAGVNYYIYYYVVNTAGASPLSIGLKVLCR
jgi:hypothetical protein